MTTPDPTIGPRACDALLPTAAAMYTYEPGTGLFRHGPGTRKAGKVAGSRHKASGYVRLTVGRRKVLAHRLAWFLMHGAPVPAYVDHENMVRHDCRIANLRATTNSQNLTNAKVKRSSVSGVKYVSELRRKGGTVYVVSHRLNGKRINIGTYRDKFAAGFRAMLLAIELHGDHGHAMPSGRSTAEIMALNEADDQRRRNERDGA